MIKSFAVSLRSALTVAVVLILGTGGAHGAASEWWKTDQGAVRLIAASDAVGYADALRFGLHFTMIPGWKIYWRSPGDAGFPPRPNWAGSENLAEATVRWPVPHRFTVLGLNTLGYEKEVVLPVTVTPFEAGKPVRLRARMPYLICSDICVPYEAKLALDLPAGPELSTPEEALIDRFARRVPAKTDPAAGLTVERAEIAGTGDAQVLLVSVASKRPLKAADLYVEGPEPVRFGAPTTRVAADGNRALMRIDVGASRGRVPDLVGTEVTLTLVDGERAVEQSRRLVAAVGAIPATVPVADSGTGSLLVILALALIGGLILNLMPCVLPVLSIKLLSVIAHGGGEPARVRRSFLASAAGIVFSFLVLGTIAVGLKSAGLAAGWGIQFQQPLFLAAMIVILTLFAANLWGLFEIHLPGAAADAAARAGSDKGLRGPFMTGAFATLLATPCSAPFLGSAVGFALSRGPAEIYAVFAMLGVGLALPYLLVTAAPRLVTRLPRPGRWMVTLCRILGLALFATAVWLITVLATQAGVVAAGMVGTLMAATVVALWQLRGLSAAARRATWGIVAALAVMTLVTSENFGGDRRSEAATAVDVEGIWQPFDRDTIAGEVRLGRVVFVDVTADWCLTCQVNKTLVLDRGPVLERLRSAGVTAMKADWTRPDPRISQLLSSYGRYGIPFNVVYGPGTPNGEPLPEILTDSAVLEAMDRAARTNRVTAR